MKKFINCHIQLNCKIFLSTATAVLLPVERLSSSTTASSTVLKSIAAMTVSSTFPLSPSDQTVTVDFAVTGISTYSTASSVTAVYTPLITIHSNDKFTILISPPTVVK